MAGPLSGVIVVDLSEYIAGPFCGMLLADMGADVIKVEPPRGDNWRFFLPGSTGDSRPFIAVNRGKRSLSVDVTTPEGFEIVFSLLRRADVLLQNFRPGVAQRLGLGFDAVAEINPQLVYCQVSGFGGKGPASKRAGFDLIAQAGSGMLTADPEMTRDGFPARAPIPIADIGAGMLAAAGIGFALFARQRTGLGQRVDTSLLGAALAFQTSQFVSIEDEDAVNRHALREVLAEARANGVTYEELVGIRRDALHLREAPPGRDPYRGAYYTQDGIIVYTCLNQRLRRDFLKLVGLIDPRDAGQRSYPWDAGGAATMAELSRTVAEKLRGRPTDEWVDLMAEAGIPVTPLRFIEELFEDDIVEANGLVAEHLHTAVGLIKMLGLPIEMSDTPPKAARPAPMLGEHTGQILAEIGFGEAAIADLAERGVVRLAPTRTNTPIGGQQ